MKKSALEVVRDVRSLILSIVPSLAGGDIYQFNRQKNSIKNDVVLNVLGASNEYMQFAILNINIHVPNLTKALPNNAGVDDTQPDLARFDNLVALILPMVEAQVKDTFRVALRNDNGLIRDNDNSWYYNIQVDYWSYQGNNKKI